MLKVGLTGGYASGKSLVAGELQRLGCHVIHADLLGHAVLEPGAAAYGAGQIPGRHYPAEIGCRRRPTTPNPQLPVTGRITITVNLQLANINKYIKFYH